MHYLWKYLFSENRIYAVIKKAAKRLWIGASHGQNLVEKVFQLDDFQILFNIPKPINMLVTNLSLLKITRCRSSLLFTFLFKPYFIDNLSQHQIILNGNYSLGRSMPFTDIFTLYTVVCQPFARYRKVWLPQALLDLLRFQWNKECSNWTKILTFV